MLSRVNAGSFLSSRELQVPVHSIHRPTSGPLKPVAICQEHWTSECCGSLSIVTWDRRAAALLLSDCQDRETILLSFDPVAQPRSTL